METQPVYIETEWITLAQFLKMTHLISSGGMARPYLEEMTVTVNGEDEKRRGKKLHVGDTVNVEHVGAFIIASGGND